MWLFALAACTAPADDPGPPAGGPSVDPALAAALDTALQDGRASIETPGATQVVLTDGATWGGASGWADFEADRDAVVTDRFRIGSITKILVAATAVSLDHDGALPLDDLASTWVPDAPYGDTYTLRQALAHQTGVVDYAQRGEVLTELAREWTPQELMAVAAGVPQAFAPGTGFEYSNTNYVVVGLAIEQATGRPWQEVTRERTLDPAGVSDLFFPTVEPVPGGFVRGYLGPTGQWVDVTDDIDSSIPWASGEIIASAEDLAITMLALFSGDTVAPAIVDEMTTEGVLTDGTPTGYGLGVYLDPAPDGDRFVGHSGSTLGFQSRARVLEGTDTCVVTLVNNFFSEADVLDAAAWDVLGTPVDAAR